VKLVRATAKQFDFQLGKREKRLLMDLLALYPCLPPAHQILSRKKAHMPEPEENQRLLDEALAEQRAENKKHLEALLADPGRFHENSSGWRLSLAPSDLEWLLQILNDIRVGNWVRLGSPEELFEALDEETAPHYAAMEMAGIFQMQFLTATQGPPEG
jgi:hypothetical protein